MTDTNRPTGPSARGAGAQVGPAGAVVADLIRTAEDVASWRVPQLVVDVLGPAAGTRGLRLLLVDHQLVELHEAAAWPAGSEDHRSQPVDGSRDEEPAGWAFRHREVVRGAGRLCQPVSVRGHRLGVLVADLGRAAAADVAELLAAAAPAVALLLRQAAECSDVLEVRRRSHVFSVAAEVQSDVLPPPEHRGPGVELAALVEPAYLATSDLFDWAVDDDVAWLALLEAAGEGFPAVRASGLALGSLRHGRRSGLPTAYQVATADDVLHREHGGDVSLVLVRLDLRSGRAQLHVAGDAVVLHRRGEDLRPLPLPAGPALGGGDGDHPAQEVHLEPGDDLVLVSSGVLGATSPEGRRFGVEGVRSAVAADLLDAPRSLARAVLAHVGGELARDATGCVLRWSGPPSGEPGPLPGGAPPAGRPTADDGGAR